MSSININFNNKEDLTNNIFVELLKQYQSLVHASIGPLNGKLSFLANSSDQANLTICNGAKCLLNTLYKIDHLFLDEDTNHKDMKKQFTFIKWKFSLISNIITNSHLNHFYDSGLFLCHLVNEFLIQSNQDQAQSRLNSKLNKFVVDFLLEKLVEHLIEIKQDKISASNILIKLNLNNTNFLRNLLRSILKSKCLFGQLVSRVDDETFINLCLKAFVGSFNGEEGGYFSRINFMFNTDHSYGLNDSKLYEGILIKLDEFNWDNDHNKIISYNLKSSRSLFKCVLFEDSFSGDFEHFNVKDFSFQVNTKSLESNKLSLMLTKKLMDLFDYLIHEFKIDVVLCQKVIHPSIKNYLKNLNVIFVDRLSLTYIKPMSELTGCKICSSSWNKNQFEPSHFGYLSSISIETILNHSYLHLQNKSFPMQTMIVSIQNESYKSEIEHLLNVAHYSYQRTLMNGACVTGGPCFYTYCLCYLLRVIDEMLTQKAFSMSIKIQLMKKVQHVFMKFVRQLIDMDKRECYKLNLESGHLFLSEENSITMKMKCCCGLFQINSKITSMVDVIDEPDLHSHQLKNLLNSYQTEQMLINGVMAKSNDEVELLDCYESKLNAIKVSRDILASILNIGVFIFN